MEALLGQLIFALVNGIVSGLMLALLGLGLGLIYQNLRMLNFAHGAFYMLGAMLGSRFQAIAGFWPAMLLAPMAIGTLGAATERFVLRPLRKPELIMIGAIGIMVIIQALSVEVWGTDARAVNLPITGTLEIFDSRISFYRIFAGATSFLLFLGVWGFLKLTQLGLWIRAVGQDRELALSQGIPVPKVFTFMFGLGVAVAALAGVLISPIIGVHPGMGDEILILALIIVFVGTGIWSMLAISLLVAIADNFWPAVSQLAFGEILYPSLARAVILLSLVSIILIRSANESRAR